MQVSVPFRAARPAEAKPQHPAAPFLHARGSCTCEISAHLSVVYCRQKSRTPLNRQQWVCPVKVQGDAKGNLEDAAHQAGGKESPSSNPLPPQKRDSTSMTGKTLCPRNSSQESTQPGGHSATLPTAAPAGFYPQPCWKLRFQAISRHRKPTRQARSTWSSGAWGFRTAVR